MHEDSDAASFEMMAGHIRTIAETMLKEHFGERCDDYEPDCMCCQRWRALDKLLANPYESKTTIKEKCDEKE